MPQPVSRDLTNGPVLTAEPAALRVDVFHTAGDVFMMDMYEAYREAFGSIAEIAVQEHLMGYAEFAAMCRDERIGKYVAIADDGLTLAGMSVMTSDLDAWPLVSRRALAGRYPGRKVFYVGFVATDGTEGAYVHLIRRMYREVIAADGVAVMDFCGHHVDELRIVRKVDVLLRRTDPRARHEMIDRQEFHAWDFRSGS